MTHTSIQEAMDKGEGTVKLRGWCFRERGSSKVKFIILRDSTNIIQCVVKPDDESLWEEANKVSIETSLELEGEIKPDDRAPTKFEVAVTKLKIIGESDTYPITKDQSTEFLLDKRHLWLRSRKLTAIMKIRSAVFGAIDTFFRSRNFFEIHAPIFTPSACEGGATLFSVDYFGDTVYLTQSWQLYAEAMVQGLEKIYVISPCFRSEKSKTSRHLAEFWMAEMEAAWHDLDDLTKNAEELIEFVVNTVLEKNQNELEILERDVKKLENIKAPFPRMKYDEVLDKLEAEGLKVEKGKDLRTIEENEIMKFHEKPLIITHYPKDIMAFYKPEDPEDPGKALCFDMIAPESFGEIIGGSERELSVEKLKQGLEKEGENLENYEWYLDTRKYGSVPHGGYGLGVERIIAWVCGLENIKDAIPFPRTMLRKLP